MVKYSKIAFLFPGQGAQYPGMAKDFVQTYASARATFEEADDSLGRNLSSIILNGPEGTLTETKNSQAAIYVACMAMVRVLQELFPLLKPYACAGLSLGEYVALTASNRINFTTGLNLVNLRGTYMNEACEMTRGTMAVILGLDAEVVEAMVKEVNMPHDLWAANFNCPGQVVISGTLKGIEAGSVAAKAKGAKRVLPLQVHGAFHSGLMYQAERKLADHIMEAQLHDSNVKLAMNITGGCVHEKEEIKANLIKQVTGSVRWEQGIRALGKEGVDLFIEIGCGKTLTGFNKKIGLPVPTLNIEKIEDLDILAKEVQ